MITTNAFRIERQPLPLRRSFNDRTQLWTRKDTEKSIFSLRSVSGMRMWLWGRSWQRTPSGGRCCVHARMCGTPCSVICGEMVQLGCPRHDEYRNKQTNKSKALPYVIWISSENMNWGSMGDFNEFLESSVTAGLSDPKDPGAADLSRRCLQGISVADAKETQAKIRKYLDGVLRSIADSMLVSSWSDATGIGGRNGVQSNCFDQYACRSRRTFGVILLSCLHVTYAHPSEDWFPRHASVCTCTTAVKNQLPSRTIPPELFLPNLRDISGPISVMMVLAR